MQGRVYSAVASASAQTAQVDFFEITSASTKIVQLLELHLSQLTDVKDAEEEMLLVHIKSGQTVSGSGGATPTPVPRQLGDAAFAGVVDSMNTTKANTGTIVTHESHHWNIRIPFMRIWVPDTYIILPPSGRLTVELATTPADSITFGGTILFNEVG